MEKDMALALINSQMERFIKDNGSKTRLEVMES